MNMKVYASIRKHGVWYLLPTIAIDRTQPIYNMEVTSLSFHFLCFYIALDFYRMEEQL